MLPVTRILIVGGYGVVGEQIAGLLAQRQPQLTLWLGGRHPQKAPIALAQLPQVSTVRIDLADSDPLTHLQEMPDLIVVAANDTDDLLLRSALRRGVPLIDITRWTARVRDALAWTTATSPHAPVVLASSWMASIPATLAAAEACAFQQLHSIDIDVLYTLRDRAGPNSVEYMDRLAEPFEAHVDGRRTRRKPFSMSRRVTFAGLRPYTTALFDSPDQLTLAAITGAKTVSTCIGFDHEPSNRLLGSMIRSGLWRAISGPRFQWLRHKLLYNPGTGDHHRVQVRLKGLDHDGHPLQRIVMVDDPAGQTHLTAVGAVIQIERVLGLAGHGAATPTVQFAEACTNVAPLLDALIATGVVVQRTGYDSGHPSPA